jgi:hypothetical protein
MTVSIKIEYPKGCFTCAIDVDSDGRRCCPVSGKSTEKYGKDKGKPEWCPLTEIPAIHHYGEIKHNQGWEEADD